MQYAQEQAPVSGKLTEEHLPLAKKIAARLARRYRWINRDELTSYANLGLALAAKSFNPDRGVPFACYAMRKAMFLAIDEMRKDGLLTRKDRPKGDRDAAPLTHELPDPRSRASRDRMEARDAVGTLMKNLRSEDRQLLMMYYVERLTMKEIGKVFSISESAVCLRHKALLTKLRRDAGSQSVPYRAV